MDEPLGLLCVDAHPDDECISHGGALLRYAEEGVRTAVVTCTGGELGEVVGEGMDPEDVVPRLGEVRRGELAEALRLLGAGAPRFLGYRDSGMVGTPGNDDPASFWRADVHEAVGRLVAHIRELRPSVVCTYDPFGGYGHPDHIQCHRVSVLAAEAAWMGALYPEAGPPWRVAKVYQATIAKSAIALANDEFRRRGMPSPFGEELDPAAIPMGVDDARIDAVLDVRPWHRRKREALLAHRSQVGPESFFLNVPDDFSEAIFGTEWYVRTRSDVSVPAHEDDLFTGLR